MNYRGCLSWSVGFLLGVLLLCSACGADVSAAVPADPPVGTPEATPSTGVRAVRPTDPPASMTGRSLARNGSRPHPTHTTAPGGFSASSQVRYRDGVSVSVTAVRQAVERGQGPGALPGRAYTELAVTLHNRSTAPVDLTRVVVTTAYGVPTLLAAPVYDDSAVRDFAGTVKPGRSATTRYAFAVPADQRGKVVTLVDFDDRHAPARFVGEIQ
jgi:hypothetical protein